MVTHCHGRGGDGDSVDADDNDADVFLVQLLRREDLDTYKDLQRFSDAGNGTYETMHSKLIKINPPCVPFVGMLSPLPSSSSPLPSSPSHPMSASTQFCDCDGVMVL